MDSADRRPLDTVFARLDPGRTMRSGAAIGRQPSVTRPVGILLAAGSSSRFGGNKLLHVMADGSPMAVVCARSMLSVLGRVVAVVRAEGALADALRFAGAEVVVCPHADRGMGASLAWGVGAAAEAAAWIVALADMPFVGAATVAALAAALGEGASLVAPVAPDGRRGHPVGFGREWRQDLCALEGDAGARDLLRRHGNRLQLLPTTDEGCLRDVDVPADLARRR